MSKYKYYVGKVVIKDLRLSNNMSADLTNEKLGIVGMCPVFMKKSLAEKYTGTTATEIVVHTASLKKLLEKVKLPEELKKGVEDAKAEDVKSNEGVPEESL